MKPSLFQDELLNLQFTFMEKHLRFISRIWGLMGSLWTAWHTVHTVCVINRKVTSGLDRWWNWLRRDVRILGHTVPFMLCFSSTGRTMTSGRPPFWCLEFHNFEVVLLFFSLTHIDTLPWKFFFFFKIFLSSTGSPWKVKMFVDSFYLLTLCCVAPRPY